MEKFTEEIITFFTKSAAWIFYVMIGLIAKFSHSILTGKKITLLQALASSGVAFFTGYMAYVICVSKGMEDDCKWIVPCATLVSDKIIIALLAIDYKRIAVDIAQYWTDKLK